MNKQFPVTKIGDLTVSRLIMGTNNIMGGSHRTRARDNHIMQINNNKEAVADIIEAYLGYGIDTIIGILSSNDYAMDGIRLAEERTGKKIKTIELGILNTDDSQEARAEAAAKVKAIAAAGIDVCLPIHSCVERLVNKGKEKIERIEDYLYMIRENNMIPGLSTHMPEVIIYADRNEYDVETYVQLYNASGFLMQLEVEKVHKIIWGAKKPVLTIKPLAAGHLNPFVGLNFSWSTIRPQDMVAVGCMTPDEVHEVAEYSFAALERRQPKVADRRHQYSR